MGATPHIGGPSPRIPPYIVSECQFGGDNTIDNAKKFLGKNCPFLGYLLNMKKVIRLTESDLVRLVKKVIKEQENDNGYMELVSGQTYEFFPVFPEEDIIYHTQKYSTSKIFL